MVREKLERNDFQNRGEKFRGLRDEDCMIRETRDLGVTFRRKRDDSRRLLLKTLQIGNTLLITRNRARVALVAGRGRRLFDEPSELLAFELADSRTYPTGAVRLVIRPPRQAQDD